MAKWVYVNGKWVEENAAALHFKDLSFLRGYGVFDFFRLSGNEPLFLEDHLTRFYSSAEGMHLKTDVQREELKEIIKTLIQKNNLPNTGIRLGLTGGFSEDGYTLGKSNLLISQHSFTPPGPEEIKKGIRLLSYPHQRQLPHIKSIDYLMAIWLQPLRKEKGADDLLYQQNGIFSECPRSNIFLVMKDGTIVTPAEGALQGVTRKKVIEMARREFVVEEKEVTLGDLQLAEEAFITSTTKRILPVRQIDEIVLGSPKITRHLLQLFDKRYPAE